MTEEGVWPVMDSRRRGCSLDVLLCITCFMVCALDAVWLTMPQYYGTMTPGSADWLMGCFYRVLFGSPIALLVMVSGADLLSPRRQVTAKALWIDYIAKYAAAYVLWCLVYALYRIHMMDPQPEITAGFLLQQWMVEPEHLWYLPLMIGLFVIVPILRPITASENTKLFRYLIILFIGAMALTMILTWPKLSYGEHYIFVALRKTPIRLIGQYIFWLLFGWIAYTYQPSKTVRYLAYGLGILAVIMGTALSLHGITAYSFAFETRPLIGEFSLISFFKNTALFLFIVSVAGKQERNSKRSFFLHRLAECTLMIYIIHYLILCILFDHGFLQTLGIPVWAGVWVCAAITYAACAAIALVIQTIWYRIRRNSGIEDREV